MKKIIAFTLILAALVSCTKEIAGGGEGSVSFDVSIQSSTKAAMTSDERLSTSLVKIYKADFSGLVRDYVYASMPQTLWLPVDEYRVDVLAGELSKENPAPASWEQKSYKGSSPFSITAGANTPVKVTAKVCNAVSRISFGESVKENFNEGYSFTIGIDGVENSSLVYDEGKSGAEGYFLVNSLDEPSLRWTFSGTLAKDGSTFEKSGVIGAVEGGKAYTVNVNYTIKDGEAFFSLLVDYSTEIIDDIVVFEPVSTGISPSASYEIWAAHATVHADVDEVEFTDPSAVKFSYRAEGSEAWSIADAVKESEGYYSAKLTSLTPSTTYEYKLTIAGIDQSDISRFTTDAARQLPNSSFEVISNVSGKNFYKWYDPSSSIADCQTEFWGSGNGNETYNGSGNFNTVITVPDNSDKKDGDRSVICQSAYAVVKFAAGNIFAGSWNGMVGTKGGKVLFGRPWTTRPKALRIWAKYSAGTITHIDGVPDGVTVSKSDYDMGMVKVAIGTWDYKTYGGTKESPILWNTTDKSTFVDFNTDASTIACGELFLHGDGYQTLNGVKTTENVGEWRQITIPLNYRDLTAFPTHVVVSCASSAYGDYFTGCDTAKLWLDGFEFIYE
ncbi:MAG: DUF4493 domain-containing protein [Rikenellaceae bacterium]|nr:DUF4493 domain-containing protein [Rikenellaceae bacterium]